LFLDLARERKETPFFSAESFQTIYLFLWSHLVIKCGNPGLEKNTIWSSGIIRFSWQARKFLFLI